MIQLSSVINSQKFGLCCKLFRCKKSECLYRQICIISDIYLRTYPYAAPCLIELIRGQQIEQAFEEDMVFVPEDEKQDLIHQLVDVQLKLMRLDNINAITSGGENDILPLHLLYRYQSELFAKNFKLLQRAQQLKRGSSKTNSSP